MVIRTNRPYEPRHRSVLDNTNGYKVNNANGQTNSNVETGVAIATQLLNQFFTACWSTTSSTRAGSESSAAEVRAADEPVVAGQEAKRETKEERVEFIKNALDKGGIDYDSQTDKFKDDIMLKYNLMIRIYAGNVPDDSVIEKRLINYAKGWQFNQFTISAATEGDAADYELNPGDNKYEDFGAQYVEFYDLNGDSTADIYEIFYQDLCDHYIKEGISQKDAPKKALEVVEKFKGKPFDEIQQSTGYSNESDEMKIFQNLIILTGAISPHQDPNADIDDIKSISLDEAARLGEKLSSFFENDGKITAQEYHGKMTQFIIGSSINDDFTSLNENEQFDILICLPTDEQNYALSLLPENRQEALRAQLKATTDQLDTSI